MHLMCTSKLLGRGSAVNRGRRHNQFGTWAFTKTPSHGCRWPASAARNSLAHPDAEHVRPTLVAEIGGDNLAPGSAVTARTTHHGPHSFLSHGECCSRGWIERNTANDQLVSFLAENEYEVGAPKFPVTTNSLSESGEGAREILAISALPVDVNGDIKRPDCGWARSYSGGGRHDCMSHRHLCNSLLAGKERSPGTSQATQDNHANSGQQGSQLHSLSLLLRSVKRHRVCESSSGPGASPTCIRPTITA